MSNFAERLVARGAGAPPGPGISLLTPRPTSRFESVASVDVAADAAADAGLAGTESFIAARTVTGRESMTAGTSAHAPNRVERGGPVDKQQAPVPQSIEDIIHQPGHAAPIAQPVLKEAVMPVPSSNAGEREPEPVMTKPEAGQSSSERHEVPPMRDPVGAPPLELPERSVHSELSALPAAHQQRGERTAPLATSSQLRETAPVREGESDRPSAPAISIGKIEVQFLPQEPRVAPRPQPQRTRGFDTYARARRGEPR